MNPILIVGIIIFTGFLMGKLALKLRLPKVTGYIFAGLILNPGLSNTIPLSFVENTALITDIALAFITFSVGGTLAYTSIKKLGKSISLITVLEAELAFVSIAISFSLLGPVLAPKFGTEFYAFIPIALLMASLASPTDPSATLAVEHEFKAKGEVTSTIMGVAALDDIFGIINYSLAVSISTMFITHKQLSLNSLMEPTSQIFGSIIVGVLFGFFLNTFSNKKDFDDSEGSLIGLIIGLLAVCYGVLDKINLDPLLGTMSMGVIVANFNINQERIFKILERYVEELIFLLFFTLSSMHLDFSVLAANYTLIIAFVAFRALGKIVGTILGAKISHSSKSIQKYTVGGLIPQGGIVIGLALVIKQNPDFSAFSGLILNVIIGATIIHEIVGPVLAKWALQKAGEIKQN